MDGVPPSNDDANARDGSDSAPATAADAIAAHEPTTPVTAGQPRLQPYRGAAAGPAAVTTALGYTIRQAGVFRGLRTLLKVNQRDGFDCPSCAWPDPDDRSMAEFCENGARAVADEATRHRVDAEFFAGTSIRSNFLCSLGHGDASVLFPRSPRFDFDEMAKII